MAKRSKPTPDGSSSVRYAGQWMQQLRKLVPVVVKEPTVDAVHDSRVATRRLKAALDIAGPALENHSLKPLRKVLRTLRRRLGPIRDADVMRVHLTEIGADKMKPAADWLVARLDANHARAVKTAREKIDPAKMLSTLGAWWGIEQAWTAGLEKVDAGIAAATHGQLAEFSRRADAVFSAKPSDTADGDDRDPHSLRIAGKSLRYTVEIAAAAGNPLPSAVGRTFKKMQESLGLWHDYVVLAEYALTESVADDLVLHDPTRQAVVLDLAKDAINRATRQLEKFHRLWTSSGPDLIAKLRSAVPTPATGQAASTQTETGPGLFDSTRPEPSPAPTPAAV